MTLPWPLPALLTWLLAWGLFAGLRAPLGGGLPAFAVAVVVSGLVALRGGTPWRRAFMALGFPVSLLASGLGAATLPGWAWLLPLALLLALYPASTWRDAPLFPTPQQALQGLALAAPLPPGARLLDAGCGLGAGLRELHTAYPQAELHGLEWSWPLAMLCALRCRFAQVRRGDIWAEDWSAYDLVYLFQRPESMPRALAKASAELKPGAWLVSLEFEALGHQPVAKLQNVAGKPVWLYRAPLRASPRTALS